MNKTIALKTSIMIAALLAPPLAQAALMSELDYKVTAEKVDALAGDAKGGCIDNAKSQFGKL